MPALLGTWPRTVDDGIEKGDPSRRVCRSLTAVTVGACGEGRVSSKAAAACSLAEALSPPPFFLSLSPGLSTCSRPGLGHRILQSAPVPTTLGGGSAPGASGLHARLARPFRCLAVVTHAGHDESAGLIPHALVDADPTAWRVGDGLGTACLGRESRARTVKSQRRGHGLCSASRLASFTAYVLYAAG